MILACEIARTKKVTVSESREIIRIAYLGQILIIGSGRMRKLSKEHSLEGRDIGVCDKLIVKGCRLRIV